MAKLDSSDDWVVEYATTKSKNKSLPDSERVKMGTIALTRLGNAMYPGKMRLLPATDPRTREIWQAIHAPLQRLRVLAEAGGLDSTSLNFYGTEDDNEVHAAEPLLERLRIREGMAELDGGAGVRDGERDERDGSESDFKPAAWFGKKLSRRVREAVGRKSKGVRRMVVGGVNLFSVDDARRWWPGEVAAAERESRAIK